MKIIEKLSNMIEEELEDAEKYAKCALNMKDDNQMLAATFFNLSTQEMSHVTMLHEEVVKLINQYKATNGEPPEDMMAIYEYLHDKHIDHASRIKIMQNQYKEM